MNDFDYSDLRFIFEKGIDWSNIREAQGGAADIADEALMIRETQANFSRQEVGPRAEAVDEEECSLKIDENGGNYVHRPQGVIDCIEGLKKIGSFCGVTFPEEFDGMDFPFTVFVGMGELLSMSDPSLGLTPLLQEGVGQVLLEFADERLKLDYIPKLMSGERMVSMGLTEPGAGSDLSNMKARACPANGNEELRTERVRELEKLGDVYIINGTKTFITNGFADCLVLAQTDEGISMFLVAEEDKWVSRVEKKLGIRGSATVEVVLEDSPGILVGEPGKGLVPNMLKLMHTARLGSSCQALGIAQKAHTVAKNYAINDRVQFGVHIVEHIPVKQMIFENEIELQASRALLYHAAYYFDLKNSIRTRMARPGGQDPSNGELKATLAKYTRLSDLLVCLVKYDTSELANRITYSCIQIFGGYGFSCEYPLERFYRDARITTIYEGTSQIQLREVFNGAYYREKIGLINQFKLGEQKSFVQSDKNRLFIDGIFAEYEREILGMEGADSLIKDLLEGIKELRSCLKTTREKLFLRERQRSKDEAKRFLSLYNREYADLVGFIFKSFVLTKYAVLSEKKKKVARAYIDRAVIEAKNVCEKVAGGVDDLIRDEYAEIIGIENSSVVADSPV